ncbi:MAG: peptidylprolyl isomerase [Flavobacteriaceae bacterium]|nr:peptidylprolyl isomerase [Flavobacteriaceae bacterium]
MKKVILLIVLFVVSGPVYSQKDKQVIATVNGKKITVSDFKKIYERNLSAIDNEEGKDVAKNLDLFINYKLKVKEAYHLKLDTLKSYKREMETYKNQLTAPYLQDKEYLKKLIKVAYDRTKNEIRASHILIRLPQNYTPKDTLEAYRKIISARDRILAGEPFGKVAKEVSGDKSASANGGDLGYFSAFKMLYDFEEVAYTTKEGNISMPFKTRFGYHIVKNTGTRISKGDREVAHVLVADTSSVGKIKIDEVYKKLTGGADFKELVKEYSDDARTKNKGGILPKFGTGRMVKSFEEATFGIDKTNEFSKPFKTNFGWHIVKLIKKYPIVSFKDMEKEIERRVKKNGRARLSDKAVLNRLKSEYKIVESEDAKKILSRLDLRLIPNDSLQNVLIKINEKNILQDKFVSYVKNRRHLPITVLFTNFLDKEIIEYFKENLVNTNPEYAFILKEYEDGLLLFELLQQKIWNTSKDTIALQKYFDTHKRNYKTKELSKVKGKVMNDYQTFLEENWVRELRAKSRIKVNEKIVKKLIKFYRKES